MFLTFKQASVEAGILISARRALVTRRKHMTLTASSGESIFSVYSLVCVCLCVSMCVSLCISMAICVSACLSTVVDVRDTTSRNLLLL